MTLGRTYNERSGSLFVFLLPKQFKNRVQVDAASQPLAAFPHGVLFLECTSRNIGTDAPSESDLCFTITIAAWTNTHLA